VSDREQPAPPGPDGSPPRTFWAHPAEVDALGPGQLIRRAFRLYRATPRRFLLVAAGPELIRDLLGIPSIAITLAFVDGFVRVFRDFVGIAVGISAESVEVGVAAYFGASLLGNLLWAPLLPAMLALAYATRVGQPTPGAPARG
jgi:hypothetical protein